jgi:hypothetical protein
MNNPVSKMFYDQWKMVITDWVNGMLGKMSDDDFKIEISPGKNHGVFLLGHFIGSEDDLSVFLGKGDYMFPEYQKIFMGKVTLLSPQEYPSVSEMKENWKKVCGKSEKIYLELTDEELNEPHAMIKDPEKDYFKTKARVLMAWQLHQAYHAGQLAIIASKVKEKKK